MFGERFDAHPLRDSLTAAPVTLFPPMDDRAAWASVADADRADLLALADMYRDVPYAPCTATQFLSFTRDGSRTAHEQPYFQRRRKLIAAVMDCCVTGRTEALDTVIDGLWCICEETSWVISAHSEGGPLPDPDSPVIDLFAAQTAMILSLTCQLMARQLAGVTPMLRARVRREVALRVLSPFMARNDFWWMGFTRRDLCNWTPWIVSNVIAAACVWSERAEELAALTDRALRMVDRWLDAVPEDGGCDEGVGYWNMAGGALLDCLTLLETMTGGRVTFWHVPKIRAMLSFPRRMALPGGWFVNFADCDARPDLSGERLQTAGEKLGDGALRAMGMALRGTPSGQIADVPHFTRMLMRLFHPAEGAPDLAGDRRDVWLPDLQVRVREDGGLILCCKGGHNGESHNHNDVGSFILCADGGPAIVDAGNMTYTARTFSAERYTLWNTRSAYHNVPLIGGHEQQPGPQHAARQVAATPDGLTLDMAPAYGPEAGVLRARRDLSLTGGLFTLTDEIALREALPVTWVFLLREKPLLTEGRAAFSGLTLRFDGGLSPRIEEIPVADPRMAKHYPGSLWRLTLTGPAATAHRQAFTAAQRA
ncbi:MAG: heparinase II/III family protein [Christensenellaceae bacterium]|nr:heparinase II/III family protein [Christensenellaceae bacterium]